VIEVGILQLKVAHILPHWISTLTTILLVESNHRTASLAERTETDILPGKIIGITPGSTLTLGTLREKRLVFPLTPPPIRVLPLYLPRGGNWPSLLVDGQTEDNELCQLL